MPPLPRLLGNGNGRHYLACDRCGRSSPDWPAADVLHVLAAARREGWRVGRGQGTAGPPAAAYCPRCWRTHFPEDATSAKA